MFIGKFWYVSNLQGLDYTKSHTLLYSNNCWSCKPCLGSLDSALTGRYKTCYWRVFQHQDELCWCLSEAKSFFPFTFRFWSQFTGSQSDTQQTSQELLLMDGQQLCQVRVAWHLLKHLDLWTSQSAEVFYDADMLVPIHKWFLTFYQQNVFPSIN